MYKKELLKVLVIFLTGAGVHIYFFCENCLVDWLDALRIGSLSGFLWSGLWKGSELSVILLDKYSFKWIEAPFKRLIISLLVIIVMVGVVCSFLYSFYLYFFWGYTLVEAIKFRELEYYLYPFLVTLFINILAHGHSFLMDWRQKSIDFEKIQVLQMATRFQSLRNQINPHFLFNSLNALSSLVYDDQKKAVQFIRKLSDIYRYILEMEKEEVISIRQELEFINSYIFLQKIRFGEDLIITINIEERMKDQYIIPVSLQLLLENSLKHNVVSPDKPLTVDVFVRDGHYLVVRNKLQLKKSTYSTGLGMKNLIERYQFLTNQPIMVEKSKEFYEVAIPILAVKNQII